MKEIREISGPNTIFRKSLEEDRGKILYTALRHKELFRQFNISSSWSNVTRSGVSYETRNLANTNHSDFSFYRIHIAVHPTMELASKQFVSEVLGVSGPGKLGDDIGSVYCIWTSLKGDSVTLLIRECNIVLQFAGKGNIENIKPLARQIIAAIQNDRKISTLGQFKTIPSIAESSYTLRQDANKQEHYYLKPDLQGFSKTDKLLWGASEENWNNYRWGIVNASGEIILKSFSTTGGGDILLYMANEENVFVSRKITVEEPKKTDLKTP